MRLNVSFEIGAFRLSLQQLKRMLALKLVRQTGCILYQLVSAYVQCSSCRQ